MKWMCVYILKYTWPHMVQSTINVKLYMQCTLFKTHDVLDIPYVQISVENSLDFLEQQSCFPRTVSCGFSADIQTGLSCWEGVVKGCH